MTVSGFGVFLITGPTDDHSGNRARALEGFGERDYINYLRAGGTSARGGKGKKGKKKFPNAALEKQRC